MPDGLGGIGILHWIATGKTFLGELEDDGDNDGPPYYDENGDPDLSKGIGGDPSQGQYATAATGYGGSEPPLGRGGTSYYLTGEDPREVPGAEVPGAERPE